MTPLAVRLRNALLLLVAMLALSLILNAVSLIREDRPPATNIVDPVWPRERIAFNQETAHESHS